MTDTYMQALKNEEHDARKQEKSEGELSHPLQLSDTAHFMEEVADRPIEFRACLKRFLHPRH